MVYKPQLSTIITPYNLRADPLPVAQEAPLDDKKLYPVLRPQEGNSDSRPETHVYDLVSTLYIRAHFSSSEICIIRLF